MNLERSIAVYDRETEDLVEEISLANANVDELRTLFDHGDDTELVLIYAIEDRQRPFLELLTGRRLREPNRLYFLECYAAEEPSMYDRSERRIQTIRDAQDR